ncbi:NAD(P)-dependent oxidoreductase [Streptomyces nigra]
MTHDEQGAREPSPAGGRTQPEEADRLRAMLRDPAYLKALVFSALIGVPVSLLARAFGMRVLCTTGVPDAERADASVRFVALTELLARSDYVSVHTALTDRTRGLLDASAFRRMKPTAVLVNTARGAVVDERALADAVRSGEIAAAALDVVSEEPLPDDSPLRGDDRIVVFSHLAGPTAEARAAAGLEGAAEVVAALVGRPRFAVNAHLLPHTHTARGDR